jgi:hypothetical protein
LIAITSFSRPSMRSCADATVLLSMFIPTV